MRKVTWKMFKANIWNCAVCFLSTILVSTMLFLFQGMHIMIESTMSSNEKNNSPILLAAQVYILVLFFIGVILILYTVNNYSRMRIQDYGMLMVLGCEKRYVIFMLFIEYGLIWGISFVVSGIAGSALLAVVQKLFQAEEIFVVLNYPILVETIQNTFIYFFLIYVIIIIFELIYLGRNSVSVLLQYKRKQSRIPTIKFSIWGTVAGIISIAIAIAFLIETPITYRYNRIKYGVCFGFLGLYLCFTYLSTFALFFLKKYTRWYDRCLIVAKNLYFRFSENKNIIFIATIINFLVLVFININIVEYGSTTSQYMWKYPYDYVWMADSHNRSEIETFGDQYDLQSEEYRYIPLNCNEGGEYIGISNSSYHAISGNDIELKEGEFLAVLQKAKEDSETMFQRESTYLRVGEANYHFDIKEEVKEILLVAQQSEMIKILVLNDKDFQMLDRLQNDERFIIAQSNYNAKIDAESWRHISRKIESSNARCFARDALMKDDRKEDTFTLIFYICIGIFLIISSMTILAIKVWTEIPGLISKYKFLEQLGMDLGEIKRNIKKELSIYLKIPLILSTALGIFALLPALRGIERGLVVLVVKLFVFLVFLQVMYIAGIRTYGGWLVFKGIDNEK